MNSFDDLVPHMRRVQAAERDLRDLGVVWQMIESSAAISCPEDVATILPTLIQTRERFQDLQKRLIDRMAAENHAELGDELTAKAQCAIDILVRNLYERTADVGFLATDDVVREFCAASDDQRRARQADMVHRLRDYQAKYTVYDDIILLSAAGQVLARLDSADPLSHSSEPLVTQALNASGYVERFGASDLSRDSAPALLYAHRVTRESGATIGVLVLRFRFVDEMARIFADVEDDRHQMALVLIGDDQRVVVSNDVAHVPVGAQLRPVPAGRVALTSFSGREYLAVACTTHGYQGYSGPGWRAQAMVSLLTAFRQRPDDGDDLLNVPLENADLTSICRDADAINRDLRRVVWNGRLASNLQQGQAQQAGGGDGSRLKAVLSQVNSAGLRTRERVDQATKDLYRTSLSRARTQAGDLARLAADVMDRNLYERANDCRWWALSPAIQRALEQAPTPAGTAALERVLDHINGLYTVYSRLVVFDADGTIRAVSRSGEAPELAGTPIDPCWLQSVRGLHNPQQYAVSGFEPTPLHAEGDTYVYLAAIPASEPRQPALGGIAVVFNSARELKVMLQEILAERVGFAAFLDASGRVLASTHPELTQGDAVGFDGAQAVIEHAGAHYACSRVRAKGYREFKQSDGYDNQVSAVVGLRLGASERRRAALSELPLMVPPTAQRKQSMEVAVFQVGPTRYAIPAAAVIEAVSPRTLVRTPNASSLTIGLLEVQAGNEPRMIHVICGRRCFGIDYPARATDGVVAVLRSSPANDQPVLGMQVDDVLAVMSINRLELHPVPEGVTRFAPWIAGLLDCEVLNKGQRERVLIQMLDPDRITADVLGHHDLAEDLLEAQT